MFKCLQSMYSILQCFQVQKAYSYIIQIFLHAYYSCRSLSYCICLNLNLFVCMCETRNSLIIFTSAYNSKQCQPNYPFQISWLYSPLISHSLITVSLRNSSNYYINNCDGQISIYPLVYKKEKNFNTVFMCISFPSCQHRVNSLPCQLCDD